MLSKSIIDAIISYLSDQRDEEKKSSSSNEEKVEALDVSIQCIARAFGVEKEGEAASRGASTMAPLSLEQIYALGLLSKDKIQSSIIADASSQGAGASSGSNVNGGQGMASKSGAAKKEQKKGNVTADKTSAAAAAAASSSASSKNAKKNNSAGEKSSKSASSTAPIIIPNNLKKKFNQYNAKLEANGFYATGVASRQELEHKAKRKFMDKFGPSESTTGAAAGGGSSSSSKAAKSTGGSGGGGGDVVAEAEALKKKGNEQLSKGDFTAAIKFYDMAIARRPDNAIYHSNKAAAQQSLGDFKAAEASARAAIKLDPSYAKAFTRLGTALYSQERYTEAIDEGFKRALALDPESSAAKDGKRQAESRIAEENAAMDSDDDGPPPLIDIVEGEDGPPDLVDVHSEPTKAAKMSDATSAAVSGTPGGMPDLSAMASMFGGGAGGGGGGAGGEGGAPDIASLMQNPQMMAMAQNLMQDPEAMNNIMRMMGGMGGK